MTAPKLKLQFESKSVELEKEIRLHTTIVGNIVDSDGLHVIFVIRMTVVSTRYITDSRELENFKRQMMLRNRDESMTRSILDYTSRIKTLLPALKFKLKDVM